MKILLVAAVCIAAATASNKTAGFWWEQQPQGKIANDGYSSPNTGSSGGYGGGNDGAETFDGGNSGSNQKNTGGSYGGGSSGIDIGGSNQNQNAGGGYGGGSSIGGGSQNQNAGGGYDGGSNIGGSSQNQNAGGAYSGGSNLGGNNAGGSSGSHQNQNAGGSYIGGNSGVGSGSNQNQNAGGSSGGSQNQNSGGSYGGGSAGGSSGSNQKQSAGGSYGGGSSGGNQNQNAGGSYGGDSGYVDNTIGQQNQGQGTCLHQCVPYFQCNNGEIIDDGEGIIDLRIYEPGQGSEDLNNVGGSCPNILDVCCRNPNVPVPNIDPVPYPYVQNQCGQQYDQTQDQIPDVRIHLNKSKHNFDNVAQFGAYPWMAAILKFNQYDDQDLNIYQCGGSLIDRQVVMTAAHCVDKVRAEELKVRLGEWDTQSTQDHPNFLHEDYYVSKIVLHSKYYRKNVFNDIALLFLSQPANINYHINTICLPPSGQNFDLRSQFDGQTCYASGWGKDNFGQEGNWQAILKEIDIPVIDRYTCQEKLRTSRLGCNFCLHDSFMCAGGIEGKDTCTGDGGSPLVCYNSQTDSYVQAGIVSWGIGCGSTLPAVYVDVARYVDWIEYQINTYFTRSDYTGDYESKPYSGAYKSSSGAVSQYYEGDQLYAQCKSTPTPYPVGHYCYRPPRPRPVQHRKPNPRPGALIPNRPAPGGSYGSNSNQQQGSGSGYSGQGQQQNTGSGYSGQGQQQNIGSGYSGQGQQQNTGSGLGQGQQQNSGSGYSGQQQNVGSGYSDSGQQQQNSGSDYSGQQQQSSGGAYGRR